MPRPRVASSLHFRITLITVVLVAVAGGVYSCWVEANIGSPYGSAAAKAWREHDAAAEVGELAARLAAVLDFPAAVTHLLVAEGRRLAPFGVELVAFDASGRCLSSSRPDSLGPAVAPVDIALIAAMARDGWNFRTHPEPDDPDAWINRVFLVRPIPAAGPASATPAGFLAASLRHPTVTAAEFARDRRTMVLMAIALLVLCAVASSTILLFWLTRRIRALSRGVAAVANGDLATRVPASSSDEIGTLGRRINALAARIEATVAELKQKESFQRLLVANVSHDLRTPLASLRGYIETLSLADDEVSDEERARYLAVITEKLDHLDHLIAHVLVLSRIDSGQEVFRPEDFSLGELVDTVLRRCAQASSHRVVALRMELESGLPDAHADPLQIGRVLQNLVENGIKFTPDGGTVTVRARSEDGGMRVEVADTGIGIPAEDIAHVCERFYTVDRSRSRRPSVGDSGLFHARSSGLGLAIASRIIEGHGSRLDVHSVEGEGSVFGFVLPSGVASAAGTPA